MLNTFRENGWKVFVSHYRRCLKTGDLKIHLERGVRHKESVTHILPNGGMTTVTIVKGDKIIQGKSRCRKDDVFKKEEGVSRAVDKVVSNVLKEFDNVNAND